MSERGDVKRVKKERREEREGVRKGEGREGGSMEGRGEREGVWKGGERGRE